MPQPYDARAILKIDGNDNFRFLQDLVTNDLAKLKEGLIYAALLGPQGKFLFHFFLFKRGNSIFLDCASSEADAILQRLNMYKLRRDVHIENTDLSVSRGLGQAPEGAFADPRHVGLGWRLYETTQIEDDVDWDALRIELGVPEHGRELTTDSYILEHGFERLNGVDFRKGCYVGQEITARMKHKTELRKGLAKVRISDEVPLHTPITANGKTIGYVASQSDGKALAYLRFDQAKGDIVAGNAMITEVEPL